MNYSISPDRRTLTITADEGERANLRELGEAIHQDATMCDVLEHLTANSELDWVQPVETGDLTDAPMLGIRDYDAPMTDAPGSGVPVLERWAFMSYQVRSLLQALRDDGEAVLVAGN